MFSTVAIAIVGVLLLIATVIPGVRLYWPQRGDPVSRTDLGVALMTGALIAFAVLVLQLLIQVRSQMDANDRQNEAERQSLLLVLGRSQDLSGLDLHAKDLSGAYLNAKILSRADLEKANMENASLQDANLVAADLQEANLENAHLERADLRHADFTGARLSGAKLNNVNLDTAVFYGDKGGKERFADLSDADLSNASIRADLRFAHLDGARLIGAVLAPANLSGADLTDADLTFADLRGANLKGANLAEARHLRQAKDLSFAVFDGKTRWPPDFKWDKRQPSCEAATCFLKAKSSKIAEFPPKVLRMRKRLVWAIGRPGCLPGWWVDERRTKVTAHSPRDAATFEVSTASGLPSSKSAGGWAADHMFKTEQHAIPGISMVDPNVTTYAEQYVPLDEEGKPKPLTALTVYFVNTTGRGFQLTASAPPALFPLFKREFIKIYRALGVRGDLFPRLRGDETACGA
jgi:uncharacterized protein YjbI with pentapeptide repeats